MPLPNKGVLDENGEIDASPNMLAFTESGHQIDENDENDEIDEKHSEIGGARSSTTLMQIEALGPSRV